MFKLGNDDKAILIVLAIAVIIVSVAYIVTIDGSTKVSALSVEEKHELKEEIETTEVPAVITDDSAYEKDAVIIAKTIWGEARGIDSEAEKAAVAWCILNRVDTDGYACGVNVEYVATFPYQFAYDESNPVTEECLRIAKDVLDRWLAEKNGAEDVGRTLPREYIFFLGDGEHNNYTAQWTVDYPYTPVWDWSLPNPYET